MRLSPNGRRLVFVAGLGQRPAAPMATVVLEDGRSVAIEPGHSPRWSSAGGVVWGPQEDGRLRCAIDIPADQAWQHPFDFALISGNSVASGGGVVAVHRTDPRRVLLSTGRVILGATDPALSDDGVWIAYLRPDNPRQGVSTLWVERVDGSIEPRQLGEPGAPLNPRFGGTTLAWELGRGLIAACADVSNPAVGATAFALPAAWTVYRPAPVWVPTRRELWILFIADDGQNGHVKLATWTSLRLGEPRGYALGVSTGSGYDHDARPVGLDDVRVQWFDPLGVPDGLTQKLTAPRATLEPPSSVIDPPETPLPDIPWQTDPNGVVEDIAEWLFSPNQGPDIHISPDGKVRFFCKSDEVSGDGPGARIGEHWDRSDDPTDFNIGHLDDASAGQRVYEGRAVTAESMRDRGLFDLWPTLKLNHNFWDDGARLWLPRRCVSGYRRAFTTNIRWTTGAVQANVPMEIAVDVGYGRIGGKEVRVRGEYWSFDGARWNAERNYYGPPNGYNAWVVAAGNTDPWGGH
jgi:hypothetical protein